MQWQKRMLTLNEYCVYIALFALPLVFSERFFLSYELPKLALFRTLIMVMLFATAFRVVALRRVELWGFLQKRRMKLILLGIFVLILLSNLFAIAPELSFWGNYFRMQGSYTFLHYLAFFILLAMNFHKKLQWERAIMFLAGGLVLVCIYALVQHFGWDFTSFNLQQVSLGRSYASLGQPNYLASYIVVALFPVLSFLLVKKRRVAMVALLFLAAVGLAFSGSRGGFVGFAVGSVIFVTLWHFFVKKQKKLIVVLLALAAVVSLATGMNRSENDGLRSIDSRLHIWSTTTIALKDSPLFGYGLDSFSLVFPRYTDGSLLISEESNIIPDRSHNNILDILFSVGILGLALFLYAFYWMWRQSKAALSFLKQANRIYLIGALAGLNGILAANLFGFSMTPHFVISIFVLAYLVFLLSDEKIEEKKIALNPLVARASLFLFAIFALGSILIYNIFFLFADSSLKNAFFRVQQGDMKTAQALLDNASFAYPYQSYIFYILAAVDNALGNKESAILAAQKGLDFSNGEDGQAYLLLAEATGDLDYYRKALDLMPFSPRVLLNWGIFEVENENCERGVQLLSKYISILPKDWKTPDTEAYRLFYKHNPDFDKSLEYLDLCLEKIPDF